MRFEDRRDAGCRLAAQLGALAAAGTPPVVLGLPPGGLPVAAAVADVLGAPLDVLLVRRLSAPGNPALTVGAVAEDGIGVLDGALARRVGMTDPRVQQTIRDAGRQLRLQAQRLRGRPLGDLQDRTVVVVDDVLDSGLGALAAVRAARARGAARVVVASPAASRDAVTTIAAEADDVVCHVIPDRLDPRGPWYADDARLTDADVRELLRDAARGVGAAAEDLRIDAAGTGLPADLALVEHARGLVIVAHGSGSSRRSPRNRAVAAALQRAGFATLLADLVPGVRHDAEALVFDIPLRARRVAALARWALTNPATRGLPIGLYGASTGAAAALCAAAELGDDVGAVVSRGGRPDLAGEPLAAVTAPTLLIVGSADSQILQLNRRVAPVLGGPHRLEVVPGAGHLFAEPGALDEVARLTIEWFDAYLAAPPLSAPRARLPVAAG